MSIRPSLRSLRAFEAVVRLGSVGRAATELGVTQPAVSLQLRQLEAALGLRLLERRGGRLVIAPEGERYAERLGRAFTEIESATAELCQHDSDAVVTVSLLATFAQRWLIPRLASFQERYPDIEIRLLATSRLADLFRDDVDITLRFGDGRWTGVVSELLMPNDMFPVASPTLLTRRPLTTVDDLAGHVLIVVETEPRDRDWRTWLAAAGAAGLRFGRSLTFATSSHALDAAVAGLGVAIGHRPFVTDDLAAGREPVRFAHRHAARQINIKQVQLAILREQFTAWSKGQRRVERLARRLVALGDAASHQRDA